MILILLLPLLTSLSRLGLVATAINYDYENREILNSNQSDPHAKYKTAGRRWYSPHQVFHHHNDHKHDRDHNQEHLHDHKHKESSNLHNLNFFVEATSLIYVFLLVSKYQT